MQLKAMVKYKTCRWRSLSLVYTSIYINIYPMRSFFKIGLVHLHFVCCCTLYIIILYTKYIITIQIYLIHTCNCWMLPSKAMNQIWKTISSKQWLASSLPAQKSFWYDLIFFFSICQLNLPKLSKFKITAFLNLEHPHCKASSKHHSTEIKTTYLE